MANAQAIDVVERAYDMQVDEDTWCRQLAEAVESAMGRGLGTQAWVYEHHREAGVTIDTVACTGHELGVVEGGRALAQGAAGHPATRALASPGRSVTSLSEVLDAAPHAWFGDHWQPLAAHGLRDFIGLFGTNPGASALVSIGSDREVRVRNDQRDRLAMVAAHVAAGLRLRRRLARSAGPSLDTWQHGEEDSAVFDADTGRTVHASGRARCRSLLEVLRAAAVRVDKARTGRRGKNTEEGLDAWRALVDGRYSLVDRFESDGRRYVVALVNEPEVQDPRALSQRERQVAFYAARGHANKLIGYSLGLTTSTVGNHLQSAMRKLRVGRKSDLARVLPPPAPREPRA